MKIFNRRRLASNIIIIVEANVLEEPDIVGMTYINNGDVILNYTFSI